MKKRIIAIAMFLCLFVTACGQKQEENPLQTGEWVEETKPEEIKEIEEETEINWVIEEQVLPNADEALINELPAESIIFSDGWYLQNETVYRVVVCTNEDETASEDEFYKGCFIQKSEAPYTEWTNYFIAPTEWVEGEECQPWSYGRSSYILTDDGLYVLLKGKQGEYIGEWTEEKGPSCKRIESDLFTEKYFEDNLLTQLRWWVGKDKSYYLYSEEEYIHMDENFTVKEKLERDGGNWVSALQENPYNNKLYLLGPEDFYYNAEYSSYVRSGIKIFNEEEKIFVESTDIHLGTEDDICFTSETEGYLYSSYCIARFSLDLGEIKWLYDFQNNKDYYNKMYNASKPLVYMQTVNGILGGFARKDGSHVLLVAGADGTYQIWKMLKGEERVSSSDEEKQEVELALTISSTTIEEAVYEFNMQNSNYKIVLRTPNEGEDFEDFRTRIQAELSAGAGPDIMEAGSVIDMEAGAKKGFLLDLTEEFAEYETDILPSVWETGTVNGQRYSVPYSCSISTVVADGRLVNNQTCWTPDEAMRFMEDGGAQYFMAGAGEAELFFYLGLQASSGSLLIDWQNKTCSLNSEEAVRLLEFATQYADNECEPGKEYAQAESGKALTVLLYMGSPDDMRVAAAIFENNEAYIGFPTINGESGHIIFVSDLVVNQKSPCKEGAIAFLKFLLSKEKQSDIAKGFSYGFPVRKDAMELMYDYLQQDESEPTGLNMAGGIEYEKKPLSDESIKKLREIMETASPSEYKLNQVMGIVEDELKGFWQEGKSAQQALDIANSRVQLYLNEVW